MVVTRLLAVARAVVTNLLLAGYTMGKDKPPS